MQMLKEIDIRKGFWLVIIFWAIGLLLALAIGIGGVLYLYLVGVIILTVGVENPKLKKTALFILSMVILSGIIEVIKKYS